jgi:hypothetical protein
MISDVFQIFYPTVLLFSGERVGSQLATTERTYDQIMGQTMSVKYSRSCLSQEITENISENCGNTHKT